MAPIFTGFRLGFGRVDAAAVAVAGGGPTSPTDYPLLTGGYQVFSTEWSSSPSSLPISDSATTFTVPSVAQGYIRVIVVGGASGSSYGTPYAGNGAYVDALIPVINGTRFKAIVGGGGATSSSSGRGGHGCGGGVGVDSNDGGSGGGGSAFFYAEPGATSDPAIFPNGVLIAGGGGGGAAGTPAGSDPSGPSSDPIGGFNGIFRGGATGPQVGEPGRSGGIGGRFRNDTNSFSTPNASRGTGGTTSTDPYGYGYGGGGGGGAGGGGGGGIGGSGAGTTGEPATGDGGRGWGYGSYNGSGAGVGGAYPMIGGNGFRFNGINLGGGGGGSHGQSHGGGGWGGGGGSYYAYSGGSGGSGAWGYFPGSATIQGWTSSASISVRSGNVNSIMGVPTSLGASNGNRGYIVVMW